MASRLIALDECPGVHPIGIGEALRRILCKVVALASRGDLEDVCGVAQLCSGLRAGISIWRGPFMPCESCLIFIQEMIGEYC